MRNPEEIIFEINDISELKEHKSNHKIELADRRTFNKHLRLCKPIHKRLFFMGASEKDMQNWLDEGTEYYLLFVDNKPVARCAIERYSDTAWEAADVKTASDFRNKGLSKEIVSFVTRKILEQGKTATCSTLPENSAMLKVIKSVGYKTADIKDFFNVTIEQLHPEDYHKCSNIWNMKSQPLAEKWRDEIAAGNRLVYIYKIDGDFIGEGALVLDTGDTDYTIPGKRVYVSRMIVKEEYRNRGIGSEILTFLIEKATETGYDEITIGVNKQNENALHMYHKHGFTEVLFDGADEHGEYFKLMKRIKE